MIDGKTLLTNVCILLMVVAAASNRDDYFRYGQLIALSVIHGGSGPCCFTENFYNILVGKKRSSYRLDMLSSNSAVYQQLHTVGIGKFV